MPIFGNLTERISRKLERTLIRLSSNPRPPSYPYISGDGFRALTQHVHETGRSLDPRAVSRKDIVFVQSDLIDDFFADVHPKISAPYILLTHNSDRCITTVDASRIDDKIVHWFAQNTLTTHPKLTPIPIGLENAHYANAGRARLFNKARAKPRAQRNGRILVAFNTKTNPDIREKVLADFRKNPLADVIERIESQRDYFDLLTRYSFVASPPGNGEDCHRTWEALYLGTVPIVARSPGMEYFRSLGLDMMIVDSWKDVSVEIEKMSSSAENTLSFEFWQKLIAAA